MSRSLGRLRTRSGEATLIERVVAMNGVVTYRSSKLADRGIAHAFSTRIGGVSLPPCDSMHLGFVRDEPAERRGAIEANFERLWEAAGFGRRARCEVCQVHGAGVVCVRDGTAAEGEADAILSDRADLALVVRAADCVPILLASSTGRTVAAVHAGWRGVVAGVVPAAVRAMVNGYGVSPDGVLAAIGPSISIENFQVGDDVAHAFASCDLGNFVRREPDGVKFRADLRGAVERQLEASGVRSSAIDTSGRCTFRDRDEFFSHRRDAGATGRMVAAIAATR